MPENTFLEIDEKEDWYLVEILLKERLKKNKKHLLKIKAIF